MLSHEEVEKCLLRIFSAKEMVLTERKGRTIFIVFKYPSNSIKIRANIIYDEAYNNAIKEGMLPNSALEELIKSRGIFTNLDEERIKKLESQLDAQKVLLSKTVKVEANQDRIKDVMKRITDEMNEIKFKKYSKMGMSAENKAEEVRTSYYCWACSYDDNEKRLWNNYESFNKETDVEFKDSILFPFVRFLSGIDTHKVRFIARHNLWRIRYVTSLKTSEQLFGVPTSEYTNDMIALTYWSNYYQNIYEMMPEYRPPDLIIEDDEALDAYMESYYQERNKEDAARKSKISTKGKLSAFDKEEVIVTSSNELYQDIKYDKPREAQRLKDVSDIKKKARRRRR